MTRGQNTWFLKRSARRACGQSARNSPGRLSYTWDQAADPLRRSDAPAAQQQHSDRALTLVDDDQQSTISKADRALCAAAATQPQEVASGGGNAVTQP